VHKKNQGLVQKRNPKINTMIKPSQQGSRISGIKGSLAQGRSQIKRKICQKYNAVSTVKIWSLQESLSQDKEKEGNTLSINCQRKETLKEDQEG
jgi:hypothetical protein